MDKEIIITKEILEKGRSINNGYSVKQISVLGENLKIHGWYQRLIGKKVPLNSINEFLSLANAHLKKEKYQSLLAKKDRKQNKIISFVYVQPGTLSFKDQYLHPNWQKLRAIVLKRDRYTCVNCRCQEKTLHAHHLKYNRHGFIWEVPHWYIVTLCDSCHSEEHGRNLSANNSN